MLTQLRPVVARLSACGQTEAVEKLNVIFGDPMFREIALLCVSEPRPALEPPLVCLSCVSMSCVCPCLVSLGRCSYFVRLTCTWGRIGGVCDNELVRFGPYLHMAAHRGLLVAMKGLAVAYMVKR